MFACSYGIAFGALQQTPRMIDGVPSIKKEVAEAKGSAMKTAIGEWKKAQGPIINSADLNGKTPEQIGKMLTTQFTNHFEKRQNAVEKQPEAAQV